MEQSEHDIILLQEKFKNHDDQIKHIIALYESEQRGRNNIYKRIDQAEYTFKGNDDLLKKHERILLNEGKGLSYEVDRLKRLQENKKSYLITWISILSLLTSVVAIILMMLK